MANSDDEVVQDALEKIRGMCKRRGDSGVKDLGRIFQIYDKNRDIRMSLDEFRDGLDLFGLALADEEIQQVFRSFDRNRNNNIDVDEFFRAVRPPLSRPRMDLVEKAFQKMDIDSSGQITVSDLEGMLNVTKHPKYLSGEMSKEDVLGTFLHSFEMDGNGCVTKEEWVDYYTGVSSNIEKDVFFDFMMRQSWKL